MTMQIEAYDLLYKNLKECHHQGAYKAPKCGKNMSENCRSVIFGHIFAIFRCLRGQLVAILAQILVEEVLSFDLHGLTSKSDKY